MAGRPKTLKYRDGEIIIKNLSKEDADLVTDIIQKSEPKVKPFEEEFNKELCTELAYGIVKQSDKFQIITIRYNSEHQWSFIEKIEDCEFNYYIATGKIRVLIGKNIFDKICPK